ncbi:MULTISPECIES: hypothetical protein [Clostridia]|nr:hypothetical protein [Eubacterium sp. AF22-9]
MEKTMCVAKALYGGMYMEKTMCVAKALYDMYLYTEWCSYG